ncbi:MAG TPA: TetR/AcrR family transcriptional regulator [Dermatophilaceae bacterium]|nr:TetR/AcrR family transcriptional regulator [Dermatophilaceae bacterium]
MSMVFGQESRANFHTLGYGARNAPKNDSAGPASSARAGSTPGRSSSQRLGRPDWVDAALRALAVGGLGSLSVERLASELGATKGSFYWHFKNRSALVDAALVEWERRDTDQLIERASELDAPRERLRWLFRLVFSDAGGVGIDTALLADAEDPVVSAALESCDEAAELHRSPSTS